MWLLFTSRRRYFRGANTTSRKKNKYIFTFFFFFFLFATPEQQTDPYPARIRLSLRSSDLLGGFPADFCPSLLLSRSSYGFVFASFQDNTFLKRLYPRDFQIATHNCKNCKFEYFVTRSVFEHIEYPCVYFKYFSTNYLVVFETEYFFK